jgi:phosphoserine phosphatase
MRTTYFFDLDGTLIATELLPLIAHEIGLGEEMASLTRQTMNGEVPFGPSFRHRVSLLSHVQVRDVVDIVNGAPVLEGLLSWIQSQGDSCWVVTSNLDCWVGPWLSRHGLRGFTSRAAVTPQGVEVASVLRKEDVLMHFQGHRTIMVGDGANDAEIMRESSFGIASGVVNAVPQVVLEVADAVVLEEEALCRTLSRL